MIHIAETLNIGSIEGFLTPGEMRELTAVMDAALADDGSRRYDTERTSTLHSIPGHTPRQAMDIYEPAGRLETQELPQRAVTLLAAAVERATPALKRAMPVLTACREWMYVEYGPGQHITPHLDGIAPDPTIWPRQIAGISVALERAEDGGEFFVETTSADALWSPQHPGDGYHQPMAFARDGADHSADWFRTLPRTRWHVTPQPGTALLYGSQLTHGTEPVRQGRERKFISWLISENG
ncbi:2OG-Fe(II) oxygenase [Candidatus Protofrankia californiensis]|uniref:2OG-Fe(II) oxygenase n=1 Tax=Candidatus Protofrankia californiensis TaxID=1839754 RepID=UPI0010411279|nr:2OG-Fe(II) oxygenase [Candidatus Protofrankia californiensis]